MSDLGPDPTQFGGEMPAGAASSDEPKPLGVPEDYTARRPGTRKRRYGWGPTINLPTTVETSPRYMEGDEFNLASLPPAAVAARQRQLVDAGLLDPTGFRLGYFDDATLDAEGTLLSLANRAGKSDAEMLRELMASPAPAEAEKGRVREPLVVRLSNPTDIAEVARNVSVRTIGRRLREDEVSHIVEAVQGAERAEQEQGYAMTGSGMPGGPGGTVVGAAAPGAYTEDWLRTNRRQEVAEVGYMERWEEFQQLLGSS